MSPRSAPQVVLDPAVDLAALLEVLIEQRRALYEIEDERIRAIEAQAAAVATVAVAALVVIGLTFQNALGPPRNVAVVVLSLGTAALAIVTMALSILARVQYAPRAPQRRGKQVLASGIRDILATAPPPDEVRPYTHLADWRVDDLIDGIRRRYELQYAEPPAATDAVAARLRVMDAWDLRFLSVSQRAPRKRWYLTASYVLLLAELVCAGVTLLLAV